MSSPVGILKLETQYFCMAWYAVEEIDEAIDQTKELLFPFDLKKWAVLAVMVFFAGGSGFNFPSSFPNTSSYSGSGPGAETTSMAVQDAFSGNAITGLSHLSTSDGALILFGLLLVGLVLLFGWLSSVFIFVLYQSLLDKEPRIRGNFGSNTRRGARLFGFQIGLIALLGLVVALMFIPIGLNPLFAVFTVLLLIPVLIVFILFLQFTREFIPLKMMETDQGVIASWKAFYPTIREQWKQVGVYVLVKLALGVVAGIGVMLAALLLLVGYLIPFGILGVLFYLVAEWLVFIPLVLGALTWFLTLLLLVQVPVQTFMNYYAILVYHDLTS